ncbi:MAG: hypothetical protein AAF721_25945 [Myxococcota bacterium]
MRHVPAALIVCLASAGCPGPDVSLGDADSDAATSGMTDTGDTPTASASMTSAGTGSAGGSSDDGAVETTTGAVDDEGTGGGTTDDGSSGSDDGDGSSSTGTMPPVDAAVLFVNFDGPTLSQGTDDATTDVTQIPNMAMDLAAFGGGPDEAAIVAAVQADFAGLSVFVTDQRPADGDYTMVVVTPTNPFVGSAAIAPLDCDNENPSNIAFVFAGVGDGATVDNVAGRVSRETGSTMGLEHVDAAGDLLNQGFIQDDAAFTDECHSLTGAANCPGQHIAACPGGGSQNSFAELAVAVGTK